MLAYTTVWSVFTSISVYVLCAEATRSHVAQLVIVFGFLLLAAGSRALIGANAARAAAFAFAPMALFSYGASRTAQNVLVFGMGDWCGTGKFSAAMQLALLCLPMGVLAVGLWFFFHLRGADQPALRTPSRACLPWMLLPVLAVGVVGSALRAVTRPSVEELRASLVLVESMQVEEKRWYGLESARGYLMEVTCRSTRISATREPILPSENDCYVSVGAVTDEVNGVRNRPTHPVLAGDSILISRSPDGRTVAFQTARGDAKPWPAFVVLLDGELQDAVFAEHLAPALGPSWVIPIVTAVAALPLVLVLVWIARSRRRIAQILQGRDGELDANGRVTVDGEDVLVDASLRSVAAGPVVVLHTMEAKDYRAAPRVTEIERGTKLHAVEHHADMRREWVPVSVVAALILAAPVIASAALGLL